MLKNLFELSEKKQKNGKRKFKLFLHTIFNEDVLENDLGTEYQDNGITWIEKYCKPNLHTIKGTSLRAHFLDEDRTMLCGHGETDIKEDLPIFENAVMVGQFDDGYIDDVEIDGKIVRGVIGTGTIDEMCYKNFVDRLDSDLKNNTPPYASVEIYKSGDNDSIKYLGGHTGDEVGRVPVEFIYSGCALLGITPADKNSRILELNNQQKQKGKQKMDEKQLEQINGNIQETKDDILKAITTLSETNAKKDETIEELNRCLKDKDVELNQVNDKIAELTEALETVKKERQDAWDKIDVLHEEEKILKKQIAEAEVKNKMSELNAALSNFSDDEKQFAKEEIEAFEKDPTKFEINAITNKILQEIGKKAKNDMEQKKISEQNALKNIDIFSSLEEPRPKQPLENYDDIF